MILGRTRAGGPRGVSRAEAMRRRQWLLGLLATLLIAAFQTTGYLDKSVIELFSLDLRAVWFGRHAPEGSPSREIAAVVIDDQAYRTVGRWPWKRSRLAQAVRELKTAGASVVALDILLEDPEEERLERDPDAGGLRLVRNDDDLGAALREHGGVVLGTNFSFRLDKRVELDMVPLAELMRVLDADPAILELPEGDAVAAVVGRLAASGAGRGLGRAEETDLRAKLSRVRALRGRAAASSMSVPVEGRRWPRSVAPELPIPELVRSAERLGNVTFDYADADGNVRRVPLWVEQGGRLWPSLGLAAVLAHRRIPMDRVRVEAGSTVITLADGAERSIAMLPPGPGDQAGLHYVTWPKAQRGWLTQFDPRPVAGGAATGGGPAGSASVSLGAVLEPTLTGETITHQLAQLDEAMKLAGSAVGGIKLVELEDYPLRAAWLRRLTPGDATWRELVRLQCPTWERAAREARDFLEQVETPDAEPVADRETAAKVHYLHEIADQVPAMVTAIEEGLANMAHRREQLRRLLGGRICFVGWAATGLADVVVTSIDSRTPGVYIHAAVANALLTGHQRRPVPVWVAALAVVLLGLLGTSVGVRAHVTVAPAVLASIVGGWFLCVGVVAWDQLGLIAPFAGPSVAAVSGWLAVFLHRLFVEQRARRRTEERFRSYVSPAVVDILVNNPQLNSMAPQRRELTVMFTDLAGFTTTAEHLGSAKTAELLSRYLGAMTDILQGTGATLDKYLGDGIMAFWGAPLENPGHAADACLAVLRMMETVDRMNAEGAFGEAGRLVMRAGLAAGDLMVGDFGNPPRNSSYTVLGDSANLASRLESANKHFGTRSLISGRVRELALSTPRGRAVAADGLAHHAPLRFRLIGRVVVKGRREYESVYELIGSGRPPGDGTDEWMALTDTAVEAYQRGEFGVAMAGFDRLAHEFGDNRLAAIYRASIARWTGEGLDAAAAFDGTIVLEEK